MVAGVLFAAGAAKYGPWNWRSARINLSTYIAAIYRHTTAIADGEDIDESGYPHAAHIAASCAIILDAAKHECLDDDRVVDEIKKVKS